jgi:glycosyltransferase involved in cell wall biosynthesis
MIDNNEIIPLVSIICPAYNHEKFIAQALDGFVMQKTNFPFEIIVHDDASTDGTARIMRDYEEKYPHLFKNIYQSENQFSKNIMSVSLILFKASKGKNIACCEGDDYWTDPYKLQKQVDFLEQNPDYVACFHDVKVLLPNGDLVEDTITSVPAQYETIEDLARDGNYIHTPSVVFRNVIQEYPAELNHSTIGDYFLYLLLAQYGKFKYWKEEMAVYRYGVGMFSVNTQDYKLYNFQATIFLLWHYFHNKNKAVSKILFSRIQDRLNKDLLENESILKFIKMESSYTGVISKTNEEIKYIYLDILNENKISTIDTFLKHATIFYLLRVVFYKFRKKILFK